MVLTVAAQGREAMAGDEDEGGGVVRRCGGAAFRWRSGEAEASTGCAVMWRSRWRGRSGRGWLDGVGEDEERSFGCAVMFREFRRNEGERERVGGGSGMR